jgi:hypothetical protein
MHNDAISDPQGTRLLADGQEEIFVQTPIKKGTDPRMNFDNFQ